MPGSVCRTCTAACCREEAMLFGDTGIPEEFLVTDTEGRRSMMRLPDGWCVALDRATFRCTIYAARPWICREFHEGGPECAETWTPRD